MYHCLILALGFSQTFYHFTRTANQNEAKLLLFRLPGNAPAGNHTCDLSISSPAPYHYTTVKSHPLYYIRQVNGVKLADVLFHLCVCVRLWTPTKGDICLNTHQTDRHVKFTVSFTVIGDCPRFELSPHLGTHTRVSVCVPANIIKAQHETTAVGWLSHAPFPSFIPFPSPKSTLCPSLPGEHPLVQLGGLGTIYVVWLL